MINDYVLHDGEHKKENIFDRLEPELLSPKIPRKNCKKNAKKSGRHD